MKKDDYDKIRQKFVNELNMQLGGDIEGKAMDFNQLKNTSIEYEDFKNDKIAKAQTWYEKACNAIGSKFSVPIKDKNLEAQYTKAIEDAHLNITPSGAFAFSLVIPMGLAIAMVIFSFLVSLLFGASATALIVFSMLISGALYLPLKQYPLYLATTWRLKASNQFILCSFYLVTFMRHTSNFERAVGFASQHLAPPLSIDLKKVLWDAQTQKYPTVEESFNAYLEKWKEHGHEFLESVHLIQSSMYESTNDKRLGLLDKSLDVILSGTYEKMLHYAQNLQSPISTLNMLGVVMPIMLMVMLPLVVAFSESVKWYHLAMIFNIALPLLIFYKGTMILQNRPSGFGDTDITALAKGLKPTYPVKNILGKQVEINPKFKAKMMFLVIFILVLIPALGFFDTFREGFIETVDGRVGSIWVIDSGDFEGEPIVKFFDYKKRETADGVVYFDGPYGFPCTLISLLLPLGLAFSLSYYYREKTKDLMKIKKETESLEAGFDSAIFQLGNRIGDGLPVEIAFSKVGSILEGTKSAEFFNIVTQNISVGMSVNSAIFDPQRGAINNFPSAMIRSSMKVLVQSTAKGPAVAANALMNISRYLKEIHQVDERLKDLMAETVGAMKSQMTFLLPVIAGVVIGISTMIGAIIGKLKERLPAITEGGGGSTGILNMMSYGVPGYYFQWVVGIYVIEVAIVLTILINGIGKGSDKLSLEDSLGKNIKKAAVKYSSIAFGAIVIFNMIAITILSKG